MKRSQIILNLRTIKLRIINSIYDEPKHEKKS